MRASPGDEHCMGGLRQAIERYGSPVERSVTLQVNLEAFFIRRAGPRERPAEVVVLLRRRNGRYLVHTKAFYPKGVYRLLSGGIDCGEDLITAVRREAYEETGLEVTIERFLGILHYRFVSGGRSVPFTSYVFIVADKDGVLRSTDPEEAITDYREVTLSEIAALADQLESLEPDWADWGRFRAVAHRLVVEVLAEDSSCAP